MNKSPSYAVFSVATNVLDFSDRWNSAVLYSLATSSGRSLLMQLLLSSWVPEFLIPRSDRNLYESGHFIWDLYVLPGEWNAGINREIEQTSVIHHGGTQMRISSGKKPFQLVSRLKALGTSFRFPCHMLWFKRCLTRPFHL
jgi:hypothetical protein